MSLSIEKEDFNSIHESIKILNKNDEIEFRFGSVYTGKTYEKFIPGIYKSLFYSLIQKVKSSRMYLEYTKTKDTVAYYRNDIRVINDNNKLLKQKKTRISNIDLNFNQFAVRFSHSREEFSNIDLNREQQIGERTRFRESFRFQTYILDFTVARQDNRTTYEFEIEFIKETIRDTSGIFKILKEVLSMMYPEKLSFIYKKNQDNITRLFNSHFKDHPKKDSSVLIRFENNPVNIKKHFVPYMTQYSVTNKLDGIGYFLFISTEGVFLINKTNIEKISDKSLNHTGTIIHGELFHKGFHIFDTLFYDNQNVSLSPHPERLNYAKTVVSDIASEISTIRIQMKRFISSGNLEEDIKEMMRYMYDEFGENVVKHNDGLIFTPSLEPYVNSKTYKFKFPSVMSIDFFIDNKKIEDTALVYDVKVSDKNKQKVSFNNMKMKVDRSNHLYNLLYYINNGIIVECFYDATNNIFIPNRIRTDKINPNYIDVAKDIFDDMINPIELDYLIKLFNDTSREKDVSCMDEMRKFHNDKKRVLIELYTPGRKILDLGFGRGGDIHKYQKSNTQFIWGVEPNKDNYEEAKKRIETVKIETVKILPLRAESTDDILKSMGNEKADVVCSFFSLTFFFENKTIFENFLDTVDKTLSEDGLFIGTTMDGESTYNLLKGKKKIESKGCYEIEKFYEDDESIGMGKKIKINLNDTIVSEQYEYLVIFNILEEELKKRGFELIQTEMFNPPSKIINSSIKSLSALSRSFVFKKIPSQPKIFDINVNPVQLKPLDVDKTFIISLKTSSDQELSRTGVIDDNNTFFHSILKCISPEYTKSSIVERTDMAFGLRFDIVEKITKDIWMSQFKDISGFRPIFEKRKIKTDLSNISSVNVQQYIDNIKMLVHGDEEMKKINYTIDLVYYSFTEQLRRKNIFDHEFIQFVGDIFNVDIRILNKINFQERERLEIYKNNNRRNIIVLLQLENSYEPVGIYEREKNTINRIFTNPL